MSNSLRELFGDPIDRVHPDPAHVQVNQRILGIIRSGRLAPGERLPGEPEIADTLGVSRMTANKAILALVSDGWLEREKGRGTWVSRKSNQARIGKVGVVIAESWEAAVDNYYFGSLYFGLQNEANRLGIHLASYRIDEVLGTGTDSDGLVLINPPANVLPMIAAQETCVVLGASWTGSGLSCIDSDNVAGAGYAIRHLYQLGHRRIIFVGACPGDSNTMDRLRGARLAARLTGIELIDSEELISPTALLVKPETEGEIGRLMRGDNPPTAIFAAGSVLAIQVIALLKQMGLRVPEDCSVIGYDDPAFMARSYPSISTIRQPLAEMARVAFHDLIRRRRMLNVEPTLNLLEPELVERSSTGTANLLIVGGNPFHA